MSYWTSTGCHRKLEYRENLEIDIPRGLDWGFKGLFRGDISLQIADHVDVRTKTRTQGTQGD